MLSTLLHSPLREATRNLSPGFYLGPARDPLSLNPPGLLIRQGAKTNSFLPPAPMAACLDAWIRDFADKVPFSGDLAAPAAAAVETGPEASAEKQLPDRIPTCTPGKMWVSQERKQRPKDERKPKPAGADGLLCSAEASEAGVRSPGGETISAYQLGWPLFHQDVPLACIRLLSVPSYFGPMHDLMCLLLFLSVFSLAYLFPGTPSPCPVPQREVPAASWP